MKKRLTKGEKWLFAAPLLFLVIAGIAWMRQEAAPYAIEFPTTFYESHLEFSPDGKRLLALFQDADQQYYGQIYDLESRAPICELEGMRGFPTVPMNSKPWVQYNQPAWSSDGRRIASVNFTATINSRKKNIVSKIALWDASTGRLQAEYPHQFRKAVFFSEKMRFSSDDKTLIGVGVPPARYDATNGKPLNKPDIKFEQRDGYSNWELGLTTIRKGGVRILDAKTRQVVWNPQLKIYGNFMWFGDIACLVSDETSDVGRNPVNNRILLWNGKTRQLLASPPVPPNWELTEFCFSPDKKTLVYTQRKYTIDEDRRLIKDTQTELVAWDYTIGRVLWSYTQSPTGLRWPQWSPNGKWLAAFEGVGGKYGTTDIIHVFDQSGNLRLRRTLENNLIRWSGDSKQLTTITGEMDSDGKRLARRIEIHRFED